MVSVPSPRVVRHGTLRCQVLINGTIYQVIPKQVPAEASAEIASITILRKGDGTAYAIAFSDDEAHCTCPDHARGHTCKHISAICALGRIFGPAATALPAPVVSPVAPPVVPSGATSVVVRRPADCLPEGWQPGGAAVPAAKAPRKGRRQKAGAA